MATRGYGHHHPQWSFEENKRFENALAEFDVDVGAEVDLIEKIHTRVPEKTLWEIKKHLDDLCDDIDKIETGLIPIPDYDDDDTTTIGPTNHDQVNSSSNNPSSCSSRRKKKGVLWTDEEHELFLAGLKKYGKGDWKSISRFCVVTRNPTQVASHAQKWFLRHHNPNSNSQSQSHPNTVNGDRPSDQSTGLQNHTEVRKKRKYTRRKKAQEQ